MYPTKSLLAVLALLAPSIASAHPCEAEVADLAKEVTRLKDLIAADREAENRIASVRPLDLQAFAALEQKLKIERAELELAGQHLWEAQTRCDPLVSEERRAARANARALVSLDLKVAYAIPVGNVWGSSQWNPSLAMSSAWTGAFPIEVAVRYRFTPNISAGAYFQWGPAFLASPGFNGIAGGSGYDLGLGIEVVYAFEPEAALDPWISLGTGWEWTQYSGTLAGQPASVTLTGWEYINLQAGIGFRLSDVLALGPYIGFAGGVYSEIGAAGAASGYGGSIPTDGRSFHGWLLFGVKGTANF